MKKLSQALPIKINEWAQIVEPHFHDANLTGFVLKGSNSLVLFIKGEGEECYEIELRGVVRLKVTDFMEGNIILHVSLLNGPEVDLAVLAEVYNVDLDKEKSQKYFQDVAIRIQERKLMLVSLVPSYGCSMLALCEDIQAYLREKPLDFL